MAIMGPRCRLRITRETKTITMGPDFLRQRNELAAQGYTRLWAGNGQLCMEAPEPGAPLPEPTATVVNQPVAIITLDAMPPDWTPLLRAIELTQLPADSINDFMWMCEEPAGVHQYKHRETRNYAHLTGTETTCEALTALGHAYSMTEKWKDQPRRTAKVKEQV